MRRQFDLGGASRADVLAQEAHAGADAGDAAAAAEAARAAAQPAHARWSAARRTSNAARRFDLASCTCREDLPVSLPSQLVEQRPDVRAAEAQLHAASAEIGVAIANQLPQFTITGAAWH